MIGAVQMHPGFGIWLFAVSVGASALGGMLGMASGIFIVPILIMFGHVEIHKAIGASIISVIACSCGGAAPFWNFIESNELNGISDFPQGPAVTADHGSRTSSSPGGGRPGARRDGGPPS